MLPYLTEHFGNPSGSHAIARRAKAAIEDARDLVASHLGCQPSEVVFTGGGTEADNLAIHGTLRKRRGTAVCSAVEHHAVLHAVATAGGVVVPVDSNGQLDLDALRSSLDATDDVAIVSVMLANNETGTVQSLDVIAEVVRSHAPRAALHTDAVQAFPWLDVARDAAACDLIAVSAHKFGGPKGVGALVARKGTPLAAITDGGGQERELRSGTHNVAGIVGMAAAMDATVASRAADVERIGRLRDRLGDAILAAVTDVVETGGRDRKVAGNLHLRFTGVESESLLILLDDAGVCASAGSACASGAVEPSHVLLAMGVDRDEAVGSLRLSLGVTTTGENIDIAAKAVVSSVERLRGS